MTNEIVSASGNCLTCVHFDTCTVSREWCHSWEPKEDYDKPRDAAD